MAYFTEKLVNLRSPFVVTDLKVATPIIFAYSENFTSKVSVFIPDHLQIQQSTSWRDTASRFWLSINNFIEIFQLSCP